ncbi:DEAD/DEAH box helicase, putative [Plasmodium gallinaceum]|uniref:DEAD/DEAH box helicase, putative n=1 Tax=Plasmodium gallinaceum TaxID=5849 RepID=A0A1J1GV02_PLAGA|nr:DEAD/DEAH box helicase, putative [Plasmodium gallinaceum]CRG96124.1 DEAD/DEAH box helicase, putative [Plasmodium gallinaceum]
MKIKEIFLWNNIRRKSFFFFLQQTYFLRTKKLRYLNDEIKLNEEKNNENTYENEKYNNEKNGKKNFLRNENNNNKPNLSVKNEELKNKYEELKKKLYKKYNYYEIESDPHNIYLYEKNYDEINELNIHKMLLLGLKKIHINELNEMQINSFLTIQKGKDLLINYPNGSGKTIAYLLPILNNLYFLHDYLEKIILDSYSEKKNNNINCIKNNYKFNNNFNLYEEMNNYLLKYSYYKNNVFFEDNFDINKKMQENFHLLPPCFDKSNEEFFKTTGRKKRKKKSNSLNLKNDINATDTTNMEVSSSFGKIQSISIMNKLIEIIKINNIKLSNLNSNYNNEQELKKLHHILKYNEKNEAKNCVTDQNNYESIYRYLTINPLQINKSVIIITVNKDNINQIINVIKQLDILNRINIQTLNDVPYTNVTNEIEKENFENYSKDNFNIENLEVENVKHINNAVLCNDQIMWSFADILITTPDIFLNSFKNNCSNILPSIIIFDEIDMLFQNNAYRNTMMNIFKIIKKRPEIYNPHIDISNENIEHINKSIEDILINEQNNSNNSNKSFKNEKNLKNNCYKTEYIDTSSSNYEYVKQDDSASQEKLKIDLKKKKKDTIINGDNDYSNNKNNKIKKKKDDIQLIQLIYVCSTLPSVGHTTAGSMLTERFNNLVEIMSKSNYKIPQNIYTQWIELNKEKIINLYLYNNSNKTKNSVNLKEFSLSNKINEFENASFEHRLDILIYILKKYHENTINYEVNEDIESYEESNKLNKNNKEKKISNNSSSKFFHLFHKNPIYKTIVFVNNIKDCNKIYNFLKKHNWPVFSFHKNLSLNSRIQNLYKFYNSKFCILITTDLISRGIDTKNVDHIINFHFPSDAITYIHRLGKMNRLNSHTNKSHKYNFTINDNSFKKKNFTNYLNSFLEKNKDKSFIVTNFISTTNLPLADSIRKFENNNIGLLSLFSRKKSFKMKNKRNNSENTNNRYIDISSIKDIELNVNDYKLNNLLELNDENKRDETNNCDDISHINEKDNSYIQAPFTIFSIEDSDSDEDKDKDEDKDEEKFECRNKNTLNNIKNKNIKDILTNEVKEQYNKKENRDIRINESHKGNSEGKNLYTENNYDNNLYEDSVNNISQNKQFNENKLDKIRISNTNNIPSWDDVKFDHKKFVVERFKSKSCYLVSQVKRGKLILNSFENNNNDDELLF